MADPERTRSLLTNAGLDVRRMEDMSVSWRFEDFDTYWTFLNEHTGAIAVGIAVLSEEDQLALRGRIEEAVEPYRANSKYELPGVAQNTLAA